MSNTYSIKSASEAMKPQPPLDYIIDKLITNPSVNIFYGESGSKKTYTMINMAVCVANGKDWLGFKTKQSPVLIIDEESREKRLLKRINETVKGEEIKHVDNIYYICLAGFKLDNDEDAKKIESEIKNTKSKLVIFDALTDIMDGDENSKKDVQPVMNALGKIADNTGASLIVIHHSNKGGGYRGSSTIKGSSDLMVFISSNIDDKTINFEIEKNRDGNFNAWAAEASWTKDATNEDVFSLNQVYVDKMGERERYVLEYLRDNGEALLADIANNSKIIKPQQIKKTVYQLAKEKKIYRTNPETGNKGAKYNLLTK